MLLSQAEACKKLNICRSTILNWEKQGLISPYRTSGKHRRYDEDKLIELIGGNIDNKILNSSISRSAVIYCRVSTKKQADCGNLERQRSRLVDFANANGYEVSNIYSEIASGINENRRELSKMIEYIKKNDVKYLIIEYKDRLARFGYNYIKKICDILNVEIIVLENIEDKDINQEMAEDIISIITSFSAKLYGRRGAKNVKKTLENLKEGV